MESLNVSFSLFTFGDKQIFTIVYETHPSAFKRNIWNLTGSSFQVRMHANILYLLDPT